MSDAPPETCSRTFRYTTIACEIVVFALIGWLLGPQVFGPNGDVIGMLIGTFIGILMMFITLFYIAGLFGKQPKK